MRVAGEDNVVPPCVVWEGRRVAEVGFGGGNCLLSEGAVVSVELLRE